MELCKLLIAEGDRAFALALAGEFRCGYSLRISRDGNEAGELLRSFRPDVLVLDLMLPGLDGISLLEEAAAAQITPVVLATSRFLSDYVLESTQRLGVAYLMRRPCSPQTVAARLRDLTEQIRQPRPTAPDPRTTLSGVLLDLGIPTRLRGYGYLREAILLMAGSPGQSITKELYPAVAAVCSTEAVSVERSIRSAIGAAWQRRDGSVWKTYFGPEPSRPSNGEFICRLANSLNESAPSGGALPNGREPVSF